MGEEDDELDRPTVPAPEPAPASPTRPRRVREDEPTQPAFVLPEKSPGRVVEIAPPPRPSDPRRR